MASLPKPPVAEKMSGGEGGMLNVELEDPMLIGSKYIMAADYSVTEATIKLLSRDKSRMY